MIDIQQPDDAMVEFFKECGYTHIQQIEGRGWCAINRFIYTHGVLFGMDRTFIKGRYCFQDQCGAEGFLLDWDGITVPVVGVDGCTAIKG